MYEAIKKLIGVTSPNNHHGVLYNVANREYKFIVTTDTWHLSPNEVIVPVFYDDYVVNVKRRLYEAINGGRLF